MNITSFDAVCVNQLIEYKDAVCQIIDGKPGTGEMLLKLHGGSLLWINAQQTGIYATEEKKRRLPGWMKRGTAIYNTRYQETDIIESVGTTRVQIFRKGDHDLRTVLQDSVPVNNQPSVPAWITVGTTVKHERFTAVVTDIQGCLVKIHKDWGCNTFTDNWVLSAELQRIVIDSLGNQCVDRTAIGLTEYEIEKRRFDINYRVYGCGPRYGKEHLFTDDERRELAELNCRSMINSCLIYSGLKSRFYDPETDTFGAYGIDYAKPLGRELTLKLIEAQQQRFQGANKQYNGNGYYSCTWADDTLTRETLHRYEETLRKRWYNEHAA